LEFQIFVGERISALPYLKRVGTAETETELRVCVSDPATTGELEVARDNSGLEVGFGFCTDSLGTDIVGVAGVDVNSVFTGATLGRFTVRLDAGFESCDCPNK